jgi:hypothetical protein
MSSAASRVTKVEAVRDSLGADMLKRRRGEEETQAERRREGKRRWATLQLCGDESAQCTLLQ